MRLCKKRVYTVIFSTSERVIYIRIELVSPLGPFLFSLAAATYWLARSRAYVADKLNAILLFFITGENFKFFPLRCRHSNFELKLNLVLMLRARTSYNI